MAEQDNKKTIDSINESETRRNEILSNRLELQRQLSKFENDISSKLNKRIQLEATILDNANATKDIEKQILKNLQSQALIESQVNMVANDKTKKAASLISQIKKQIDSTFDLGRQELLYNRLKKLNNVEGAHQLSLLNDQLQTLKEENNEFTGILDKSKKLDNGLFSITGNIVAALPGLGKFSQTFKDAAIESRKAGGGVAGIVAGTKKIVDLAPEAIFTMLAKSILQANSETVELGKALGKNSYEYRENLAQSVRFTNNINYTTANLVKSFNELTNATGLAYEFTVDQLEVQTKLTKQVGLQAEEAAQIQKFGVLTGKTSEQTYNSFIKGLVATRNQLRVGIDFKTTLAEAVKVSGQLATNLGYNPERIAKAVIAAKAFGMTLDQTAKSGESLLNFESSIENQAKAQLLTGKQLNLEKARYAALTGDQITLAEELSKQVGTAAEFTQMNVIQQKSLAEAVGMTTDELANTLVKREQALASGKSLAQITEEEAKTALERQTIQDKFNASILKLQDFFGNLVAGPLGQFVSFLANGLDYVTGIAIAFGTIYAYQKGMALYQGAMVALKGKELAVQLGIAAAWAVANPFLALGGLAIAGGIASLVASQMSAAPKFADGGIVTSPITNATIGEAGPEAIIPLNSPKANSILGGGPSVDLTLMVTALNDVKSAIVAGNNKQFGVNLDGRAVGTGVVRATYRSA